MAEFDVVVWGATGFTGALVAEYMAAHYGVEGEVSWAIAGRDEAKLKAVADRLDIEGVPRIVADSHDVESLRAMVGRTAVMCTTVGPYAKYGSELVAVCAELGVDYCDLTGELPWMRQMIDQHGAAASASGARIVHTCGFDSIPSDLGVSYVQSLMHERHGCYAEEVKYRALDFSGGFSGGTVASGMYMMEQAADDPMIGAVMADPYALNTERGLDGLDSKDAFYDKDFESWAAPFVMAGINTRVVRRSHELLDYPYGRNFRYNEATLTKDGVVGALTAGAVALGTAGMNVAMGSKAMRSMMGRVVPEPGEGPTEAQREAGFFKIALLAKHPTDASLNVLAYVAGDRDPGYGSTAKMLAESAVCLAKDGLNTPGGFTTPAASMGKTLIDRLHANAGVTFTPA